MFNRFTAEQKELEQKLQRCKILKEALENSETSFVRVMQDIHFHDEWVIRLLAARQEVENEITVLGSRIKELKRILKMDGGTSESPSHHPVSFPFGMG